VRNGLWLLKQRRQDCADFSGQHNQGQMHLKTEAVSPCNGIRFACS